MSVFAGASLPACAAIDTTATFAVEKPTEVPGATLKPGTYTIALQDHLSDRAIVRLDSATGGTHLVFLGVNAGTASPATAHPVEWNGGQHKRALRGFVFAGGRSVEFVYPKAEAVVLANANEAGVVAIDPVSEGRPAELSNLSTEDMHLVNLWLLTPVRVGPNNAQKGIDAKHYQGPAGMQTAGTAVGPTSGTISGTAAVDQGGSAVGASSAVVPAGAAPVAVARLARPVKPVAVRPHQVAVAAKLPKTASAVPLTWLLAAVSLLAAGVMRWRRERGLPVSA